MGTNVLGLNYVHTTGDLSFDPVLEIEDAQVTADTVAATYSRSFGWFGQTARVDLILPYQASRWEGLLSGSPASREREGFADPWIRLSVDVVGAPALEEKEFFTYRAANPISTVVGIGLGLMLPLGDYQEEKLLNLGQNRFVVRPQVGVLHTRGPWSFELTSSVFLFADNHDFFGGNELEQEPLFDTQAHVIHSFQNGCWASASIGYGFGGESAVNGIWKDDEKSNLLSSISLGVPLGATQGLKIGYVRGDTQNDIGADTDNVFAGWSVRF